LEIFAGIMPRRTTRPVAIWTRLTPPGVTSQKKDREEKNHEDREEKNHE
jgi:hypothetical protein